MSVVCLSMRASLWYLPKVNYIHQPVTTGCLVVHITAL